MSNVKSSIKELNNKVWLNEKYWIEELSDREIAELLGCSQQRVRRARMKFGIRTRTRSEAQAIVLKRGVSPHPTKGKARPSDVKNKISEKMVQNWSQLSEEELKKRAEVSKENWKKMPQEKKDEMHKLAIEAVRKTAKEGSHLEKFLRDKLTKDGYEVSYHVKRLVPNSNLEIDMYLPELTVAIEIDGPSHFLPIWGEDSLRKNIRSDIEKTGLIINQGFVMIRIKQTQSFISEFSKKKLAENVTKELLKIKEKFPEKKEDRLIEIEL